jgi:hypothetical protein
MKVISNAVALGAFGLAVVMVVSTRPSTDSGRPAEPATGLVEQSATGQDRPVFLAEVEPDRLAGERRAPSLHSRIERLLERGGKRDRYQAFVILAHCAHTIDFDRHLKSLPVDVDSMFLRDRYGDGKTRVAAACGDLSERDVNLRFELAAGAADEGIPGAASAWIEEGPFGDKAALTQRPDDPLIVEWVQQAIVRVNVATKRDDIEAIRQFAMLSLNWELNDVARVRLLVEAAQDSRHEAQTKSVLDEGSFTPHTANTSLASSPRTGVAP